MAFLYNEPSLAARKHAKRILSEKNGLVDFTNPSQHVDGWPFIKELISGQAKTVPNFGLFVAKEFGLTAEKTESELKEICKIEIEKYMKSSGRDYVSLSVVINSESVGELTIELFTDIVPQTCKNFVKICESSEKMEDGKPLTYDGTLFHRVVPSGWIQGGDVEMKHGAGGVSAYGKTFDGKLFVSCRCI